METPVVPPASVNLDCTYTGVIISRQDDTLHFMTDEAKEQFSAINEALNSQDLTQAETINEDECYVFVKANFPGRVRVISNSSSIDVINIDTGMKINQAEPTSFFTVPRFNNIWILQGGWKYSDNVGNIRTAFRPPIVRIFLTPCTCS